MSRTSEATRDVAHLTTEEILDMLDELLADAAPWQPNTPPATPQTPVPRSPGH